MMITDLPSSASKYPVVSPAMPAPTIQTSALALLVRAGNLSAGSVADQMEKLLNLVEFLRDCFFVGEAFRLEELERFSGMAFPLIVIRAVLGCHEHIRRVQDFGPKMPANIKVRPM